MTWIMLGHSPRRLFAPPYLSSGRTGLESGRTGEEIEGALQLVGGDAVDDLGAALSGHVVRDHLAGDSDSRSLPKNDRPVAECQ